MTDEQRYDTLGAVNPEVQTPHLDRLAEESLFFTRAYTTNPSCVPARAAMFTGRYPSQCGAPTFITYVNPDETTFMSLLRDNGYYTAVVGKQHFGQTDIVKGYDDEEINDLHSAAAIAGPKANEASAPSYIRFLREAGFTQREELFRKHSPFTQEWLADVRYHLDDFIGERGNNWLLNKRPAAKPWFLCVSFPGPHQPFDCLKTPQAERYDREKLTLPQSGVDDLRQKPPHYSAKGDAGEILSEEEIRTMHHSYYANVTLIDEKIGGLLQTLKVIGEYDNTLIVFTSDHGDFLGDFGLAYKGQYLSEALMHVPFIVKPPVAGYPGRKVDDFAANFDIAATCLGAAGIEVPANMSCRDLSGYWKHPETIQPREFMYTEASDLRGIRTDRWKLIHYRERTYGELYDLHNDPQERCNLWNDPSLIDVKLQLYTLLTDQWIALGEKSHIRWNVNAPAI